jgi:hypothetical protein
MVVSTKCNHTQHLTMLLCTLMFHCMSALNSERRTEPHP